MPLRSCRAMVRRRAWRQTRLSKFVTAALCAGGGLSRSAERRASPFCPSDEAALREVLGAELEGSCRTGTGTGELSQHAFSCIAAWLWADAASVCAPKGANAWPMAGANDSFGLGPTLPPSLLLGAHAPVACANPKDLERVASE